MKSLPTVDTLQPILHNQIPVITTELLARLYGSEEKYIRQNFKRNENRFITGKHYYKVTGSELYDLRTSQRGLQISPKARALILWTERGAARHAKMLETDQAWEVFERLEDCYFNESRQKAEAMAAIAARSSKEHDQFLTQPAYRCEVMKQLNAITQAGAGSFDWSALDANKVVSALLADLLRNTRAIVSFDDQLRPQFQLLTPTSIPIDPMNPASMLNIMQSSIPTETLQAMLVAGVDKLAKASK